MGFLTYVVLPLAVLTAIAWTARTGFRGIAGPFGAVFRAMPLTAAFGLTVVLLYVLAALAAPVIAPYGESQVFDEFNLFPGENPDFVLGTDQLGRDLLTRLLYGGRNTIGIAFVTTALAFLIGATFGFIAAVLGGWLDQVVSRTVDVLMAIPQLIFALLLLTIFGQSTINMILVIAVLDSTRVFRLARAVAVDISVMDYVEAARLRGERLGWIIFREVLPNALSPLVAEMGLRFIFMVLFVSTLSFLGLGVQPPLADWGGIVKENQEGIVYGIGAALYPAVAIAALAISVNLVADWILNRTTSLKGGRG